MLAGLKPSTETGETPALDTIDGHRARRRDR